MSGCKMQWRPVFVPAVIAFYTRYLPGPCSVRHSSCTLQVVCAGVSSNTTRLTGRRKALAAMHASVFACAVHIAVGCINTDCRLNKGSGMTVTDTCQFPVAIRRDFAGDPRFGAGERALSASLGQCQPECTV